jgi:hypothetical protein
MIKTAVLISDIISRQGTMEYSRSFAPCSIELARPCGRTEMRLSSGKSGTGRGPGAGQTVDAAFAGSAAAVEAARKAAGGTLTKGRQFGVRIGALSSIGGGIKNTAATLLTGQEKKEGGISVGGGYSMDNKAKDNSRTRVDSKQAARSMGSKYGKEWAKDKAPKAPEEPEKPTGVEGLKRD